MRSTSSPRAVSMMIGICDSARTLRHRLRPSSPGSITSRIRRSTRWSVMARTISRPSVAVVTLQALVRRYFAISSSDQDALSSALTDIDSSLQSSRASDSAGGTRPSPGDLKSKIDDLIAGEVSSGKLTSDQATELQGVFKAAFANGPDGAGGPGGAGGAHGHHGGQGGPPPADSASSSDSTSSSSGTSSASDILQQFLQSLQDSLSASSSTPYSATGTSGTGSNSSTSFSALLIDYQT